MSRILEGEEAIEVERWMAFALEEGKKSPCAKDKRGVVIVKNAEIIGRGFNTPPEGFNCVPEYCMQICRIYCVHAEMKAIGDAWKNGKDIYGARMYHARVENNDIANSRKPRCADCSKHILDWGINEFVLKHEEGFTVYQAREFHKLSLDSLK